MSKRDLHDEITAKIVALLETNPTGWLKPWAGTGTEGNSLPFNAVTGKAYRGINIPMLWASQRAGGFTSNRWASYNQWGGRGAHVRKGEKGTMIVFYKSLTVKDGAKPDNPDATKRIPLLRCWTVFNADQVEGDKIPVPAPKPLPERLSAVESYISATGARVHHGEDKAFYSPALDFIGMPGLSAFHDTKDGTAREHYYSVFLHELTHWTGAKGRCDRSLRGRFGDEEYAVEELIAELGAAFQCASLGIDLEPRADHAKYIASWLKVLKGDKRAVFTAASKAAQACDFLNGLQPRDDEADGDGADESEMQQAA